MITTEEDGSKNHTRTLLWLQPVCPRTRGNMHTRKRETLQSPLYGINRGQKATGMHALQGGDHPPTRNSICGRTVYKIHANTESVNSLGGTLCSSW